MGDALAHRGPDGEGMHVDEARPSLGLISRRLAVIDVEHGTQPMTAHDCTIVYNGEVFNATELRTELESAGHRFRTTCDTEVVLHGYVEWGADVLQRLNGMWALAVWDAPRRRLFLARDRLGVKPLVYASTPDGLAFASEIKSLVASGHVARRLDLTALPHYLSSFTVPEPQTFVYGVRRLPAGHALIVDPDNVREHQYWDCASEEEPDRGATAYADEVEDLLADSVRRRLVSDVPVGVLLSGGVDSALLTALASRASDNVRTFTLGFDEAGADERAKARSVAEALGTEHHDEVLHGGQALRVLPELYAAYDEPGQSLVQTHFVSRLARREVTVGLSGLGADELFAAYPTHVVVSLLRRFDRLPPGLRGAVLQAARVAPSSRVRRAAGLLEMEPDRRVSSTLLHQIGAPLREELLAHDLRADADLEGPERALETAYAGAKGHDPLNRLLYVFLKTYLPDELLRATDAMSMLHSLEIRTPFLDYRLVELAMRMPAHHKMRLRTGKLVLRAVAARTLPDQPDRAKRGFSPPVETWLRSEHGELVREALAGPVVRERGVFDSDTARRVLDGCMAGDARMTPAAMMLYAFETWAQQWLDAPATPSPSPVRVDVRSAHRALSVVIVNWNTREILRDCLASLSDHLAPVDHEVIVVDNASGDGSAEMVARDFPDVRLIRNTENVGFGAANNQAMRVATGEWLLLLNSDTLLTDDSVARLFDEIRLRTDLGVAHCRLRFPDGRLQYSAHRFSTLRLAVLEDLGLYKLLGRKRAGETLLGGYWEHDDERDVDWVIGAFMLLPRDVFRLTGGFDERIFMYGEDIEWCHRIADANRPIRFFPQAEIVHRDHSSSEMRYGDERVALCLRRQHDLFRERNGSARARLFMAVRVTGAALRAAWYSARARAGGRRGDAYRAMQPSVVGTYRLLRGMAMRRR